MRDEQVGERLRDARLRRRELAQTFLNAIAGAFTGFSGVLYSMMFVLGAAAFKWLSEAISVVWERWPLSAWPLVLVVFKRFPRLVELKHRLGRHLSGGEQQMRAIGRAIMTGPALMLLDEPSQGLAPIVLEAIVEMLRGLKGEGLAMLLVEQIAIRYLGVGV